MFADDQTLETVLHVNFRLAHISDIHLGPLPLVTRRDLISKRITGYINWQRKRANAMNDGSLETLISHLKSAKPDHIAVTGDLVNLALDEEIRLARKWLDQLGRPTDVSVVPGNHDTYVPGALAKIIEAWRPFMKGEKVTRHGPFPYRRDRVPVCILGANSGRASLPFMGTGYFKEEQSRNLGPMLAEARNDGLFRVVMIHHPPFKRASSAVQRLVGAARFRKMIAEHGAELILHGHTHIESFEWIEGPHGPVPVIGVPSASQRPMLQNEQPRSGHQKPAGRYNLFEVSGEPGSWSCQMQEYGFTTESGSVVEPISTRPVYTNGKMTTET